MAEYPKLRADELPGWSDLGKYLEDARLNLGGPIPLCVNGADKALGTLVRNLGQGDALRVVGLVNYAYSNWRAAALLGQTGNAHQVPLVLRAALEGMLYANLFLRDENWKKRWEARHSSKTAADRFRKEGPAAARAALKKVDHELEKSIKHIIQYLIDFGGHANIGAIEASSTYFANAEDADSGFVVFTQLAGERRRYEATVSILESAGAILKILRHMWPDRYMLLGIENLEREYRLLARIFIELDKASRPAEPDDLTGKA
ncbi:hypothetical protein [Acidimangrovimonas sediminis]|uniref:hypothetical protein n=1 Tax=Acidimangrovimonas sediminis TaxID=2056283 RepID=UPI0011AF4259|nr:hypothetical protein [Acidimangrovimonas sediminis]